MRSPFSCLCVSRRNAGVNKTSSPGPKVVVRLCRGNKIHQNFMSRHNWSATSRRCICVLWVRGGDRRRTRPPCHLREVCREEIWESALPWQQGPSVTPNLSSGSVKLPQRTYGDSKARKMQNWSKQRREKAAGLPLAQRP